MREWFEDETFWEELYPFLFSEGKFDGADDEISSVLDLAGLQSGDVLDLACGPGRHATALAKRGFRVTGLDLSPFLLRKAKGLAHKEGVGIEWVQEDMRSFERPETFDLAISLFTSFGYFDDRREDVQVLRNVYQSLRYGGSLVMEMAGKECLARVFAPTGSEKLPDGRILVEQRQVVDDWSRIRNEWIVIEGDTATTFQLEVTIYSGQELKDRLYEAGFNEVALYGGFDRSEYGLNARRLVAVARK
ncbi:MAG: class I SAM-dependent methyltransferase [Dehalococcoidia bacterium]|nr:class I SAM-dependent methyltransferase [Dehalococcoidia bacterium]